MLGLDTPTAGRLLELEELLDGEQGAALFRSRYGCGDRAAVRLDEALWQCQTLLAAVKGKVGQKKILLLTDCDQPHGAGGQAGQLDARASKKMSDLHSTGVKLDLVPVCSPGAEFLCSKFYSALLQLEDGAAAPTVTSLAELSETVLRKAGGNRVTGRYKLDLGGVSIAVNSYNLVSKKSRPGKQILAADNNEVVKSKRVFRHPETGEPLLPSDMNRFQEYGGKNISFAEDEWKGLKCLGSEQAGLKLVCFKPLSFLKLSDHVRSAHFLQPLESSVRGSRQVFAALLDRCSARQVMAVCQHKSRPTADLSFVALVAQQEERQEGRQIKPPGFHMIVLPFLDDFRRVPALPQSGDQVSTESLLAAKDVISKLRLKHMPLVENCQIQTAHSLIEAHALHRETLVKPEDETEPVT